MVVSPRNSQQQEKAEDWFEQGQRVLDLMKGTDHDSEYRSDLNDALACFDKATALDRDYAEAWFEKVFVLDSLGSHADALIASEEVLRLRPDDPEAWFHKGIALDRKSAVQGKRVD